ncbi:MAG3090 family protein [Mycoplasma corogypsi]|uniref:MAG3090 family protein n=1 Tax=Mycoplasma corogypsi TaxID=2106 RepID=UPI003872C628
MKRLQCVYQPLKSKSYPWMLKHPKVKDPLGQFKTRKDAMSWFLNLGYDAAVWFQNNKKVWGGLVIGEKNPETGEFEYELNVDKFDGGLNYDDTLNELAINPEGTRNKKQAEKDFEQVVDFKILNDHTTYFPTDDEWVRETPKSKKQVEIDTLRAKLEQLSGEMKSQSEEDKQKIEELIAQLNDTNADKESLAKQMELLLIAQQELKRKQKELEVVKEEVPVEVVKEVETIKEVVKEVPVEVIKEVETIKEVVKEVPVEVIREVPIEIIKEVVREVPVEVVKEVVREVETSVASNGVVKYAYIGELSHLKQTQALALYAKKLEYGVNSLPEGQTFVSVDEFEAVQATLGHTLSRTQMLDETLPLDSEERKLLKLISYSLSKSVATLAERVLGSEELASTPANAVYVKDETGSKVRLSQFASYVLFNGLQVGFVPQSEYTYALYSNRASSSDTFLVFEWPVATTQQVAPVAQEVHALEVVGTKGEYQVPEGSKLISNKVLGLSLFTVFAVIAALLALVILFANNII